MLNEKDIILCRKDFGFFAFQGMLRVFSIRLNLKRKDDSKNYLWVLFNSINRLVFEKAHNQWWNIPPRCAKTTLGFIFHVAFALGNNPRAKFMYITHQRDLMREKMSELHMVLESPFYRQVFPNVKVIGRRSTRVIRTKEGGFVNGFSISGHVTGTGAGDSSFDVDEIRKYGGCIILDDLHDASCANSRVSLANACQKFEQCITSRRNTADTPFFVIGQRISVHDIFGYLEKKSERQFEKTIIPAILEDGTSIDENRLPLQELKLKENNDPYVFQSQYMQNPLESKWRIFREEDFKKIDFAYKTIGDKDLVAFIDLNSGSLNTLDRTAVGVFQPFFVKSDISYEPKRCAVWVDLLARKLDPATVEHDIHAFLRKYEHRLHAVVVEKHGIGYKVMADLQTLLPNTLILGSIRTRAKDEVFQACDQFVGQGHIFLENEDGKMMNITLPQYYVAISDKESLKTLFSVAKDEDISLTGIVSFKLYESFDNPESYIEPNIELPGEKQLKQTFCEALKESDDLTKFYIEVLSKFRGYVNDESREELKTALNRTGYDDLLNKIYQVPVEKSSPSNGNVKQPKNTAKTTNKPIIIGSVCSVIAALAVGVGCGVAGVALPMLAIAGIAVAAALGVGLVAYGITYAVSKPNSVTDNPDVDNLGAANLIS
ncbi:MAG: hypothetical protein PG978_001323 [Wolbachia endosymbiont of Ctenocephalides felis wCfeF]|nr:MAG: hypothetical protein PG978_001323 [Wolbachia endosymbiont of Ctenocephalides felis wCfeF]